jgi:Relaxase/Mobilisation nuclease domain
VIGKIILGKSFRKCLNYCLSNKPGQEEKESRAQILECNYVYGSKKEIISQFEDLGNTNPHLANKVMHITLSLPPGEILSQEKLKEIAGEAHSHCC